MATVEVQKLSQQELAQLACSYAFLILFDDGQEIDGKKINALIESAEVKIPNYWAKLFLSGIEGQNIANLVNFGSPAEKKEQEKKQEKLNFKKYESDEDFFGFLSD